MSKTKGGLLRFIREHGHELKGDSSGFLGLLDYKADHLGIRDGSIFYYFGEPFIAEGGEYYPADVDESGYFTKRVEDD